jgi:hypothetical protein
MEMLIISGRFSETFMKISKVAKNFNSQEIFGKNFEKLQGRFSLMKLAHIMS